MSSINTGNQFFNHLPVAATQRVFGFLKSNRHGHSEQGDDKAIMATARVCRHWQGNEALRWERQAASIRLKDKAAMNSRTSLTKPVRTPKQNLFFDRLPDALTGLIFKFLGKDADKTMMGTARVCLSWQQNKILKLNRQTPRQKFHHQMRLIPALQALFAYPPGLVQLFRNNHAPIDQLPVLDLGDRHDSYIDYITPDQMPHAVMKFTAYGDRRGIALKIQMSAAVSLRYHLSQALDFMKDAIENRDAALYLSSRKIVNSCRENKIKPIVLVLAIFQRYVGETMPWVDAWSDSRHIILNEFINRHNRSKDHTAPGMQCTKCPTNGQFGINSQILITLLQGQDPDFSLPGHRIPEKRIAASKL